jgi:hypothetical protein
MPKRSSNRSRDTNEPVQFIVDRVASGDRGRKETASREKNPAAVALGRLGGQKGGKARAMKLSAEQRTDIARKAALARWHGSE